MSGDQHLVLEPAQRQQASLRQLLQTLVSGGQAGVDRAALDWAIAHDYRHGGWCPRGRLAEDGVLHARYALQETESAGYRQRTKANVRDSDATLIINREALEGGTLQTQRFAEAMRKPFLLAQLDEQPASVLAAQVLAWLREQPIAVLNVAGPRESKRPGIYAQTWDLLDAIAAQNGDA